MAVRIGRFSVSITGTAIGFERVLNDAGAAAQKFQRRIQGIGTSLTALGAGISAVGASLVAPFALAIDRATRFQEATTRFGTIFEESTADVKAWGDQFATSVGRSRLEVRSFLADFRGQFDEFNESFGRGFGDEVSKALTQIAIDLASIRDLDVGQVFTNIQSGLAGESEALRKYTIDVSAATVNAKLLAAAIDPKLATQGEKRLARFSLILEQTTKAQGDAIRTSGDFANTMRRFQAAVSDAAVSIGSHLIPVLTPIVQRVAAVTKAVADFVANNRTLVLSVAAIGVAITAFGGTVLAVGTAIGGFSLILGAIGTTAAGILAPIAAVAAAIVAIGAAIAFVTFRFTKFGKSIKEAVTGALPEVDTSQFTKEIDEALAQTNAALEKIGKTKTEINLNKEKIEEAKEAAKQLQEQLEREGKALTVSLRTPFETFEASIKKVNQLLQANAITQQTAERQIARLQRDLLESQDEIELNTRQAVAQNITVRGSQAEVSFRANQEAREKKAEQQREKQLAQEQRQTRLLTQANDTLKKILDRTNTTPQLATASIR